VLFEQHGYQATTTKEICVHAETTEATLFKNFGSKAGLFEASLVEPLASFIEQWSESVADYPADGSLEDLARNWVGALVSLMHENRRLLRLLIAADCDGDEELRGVALRIRTQFSTGLRTLREKGVAGIEPIQSLHLDDYAASTAAEVSMALGMVVLSDWVFPPDRTSPTKDHITEEILRIVKYGIIAR
jgi:AcrR family transcriptional regulator